MDKKELTPERLKNVLSYEPETGSFIWKERLGKRGIPGKVAGTVDFSGYVVVTIDKKRHKAHRLAFLYMTGSWPPIAVDHINGVKTDNRFCNLRLASWGENQHNRGLQRNNKSGFMGVAKQSNGKWRAGIRARGKSLNLGTFDHPLDAHLAYLAAKSRLHPFQPVPRYA
jgi:hypothetical protein